MTFEKLHSDVKCNCTDKAESDTVNEYVRKLKKDTIQDSDFATHWERGIKPERDECEDICSYKGVSINQFKEEFEKLIVSKYINTFTINPKKGAHYLKFKLKEETGKVKFTPEDDDQSHYNLFKSDTFTLESLITIDIVKFA
ncbi:MAG: hypothetical protein J0L67_19965 [Cytophagales bacterium]|jgi:hypothetical protein|nr:hypothetical protein [Cytophagales bacterium]